MNTSITRPQEEIFQLGAMHSPNAILIEDYEGKVLFVNKRFEEMWQTAIDTQGTDDSRYILRKLVSKVKNSDEFLVRVNHVYEHQDWESKDNIEFADGRFFESYSKPLMQNDQKNIGRVWYFHDTTTLRKVEIQLRNEKETLEKYFEVIGRIVLVIDATGTIKYLNNRGHVLLGYRDGELIGKNWITEVLSKNKNYTMEIFLESVTNTNSQSSYFEYSLMTKSGQEKYITWGSAPIKDEFGQVTSFLCTGEDISDLKKAEIDIFHLKQLDKLKDEFLNIVAHELKTPLTSIIALSDLLKSQKSQLPQPVAAYPDIIFEEGMRLKNVVKRILTVTRFESGKDVMHLEHISINTFFTSILPELQTLNQKKKYSVELLTLPEDVQLETDKERISEVIINLVDNAIKYGADNQVIKVRIFQETERERIGVEVADQGQGIPPALMPKLFNKFSQLEPSLSRSQEGTGLGLYICKLIVEKLGGKIEVTSEEGKGSKFTFYLPVKR